MRAVLSIAGFFLALSQPVLATNLSDAAAAMAPGTFVELTEMANWNGGQMLNPAGCGGGDVITQYATTAVWNPVARRFQFSGSPHGGCSGVNEKAIFYDDAANSWGALPLPPGSRNDPRHSYGHNAMNPQTGEHYYTHYNSFALLRLNSAGTAWTTLASRTGNVQCCRAQAWFPDFQGGRLIHVDGDWGGRSYNPATNTWTQLWRGNGADGTSLPQFTGDGQPAFALYSYRCHCLIFGAGSNFRKMNSDGSFTALTQSGGPGSGAMNVGPDSSSLVVEPVTGVLITISGGTLRVFDPGTTNASAGAWSVPGTAIPPFFNTAGSTSESLISAPISNYGVVMYVKHDDASTGRVFLYKHSPSESMRTPSAPGSLAVN
jgi:hypothetical protein